MALGARYALLMNKIKSLKYKRHGQFHGSGLEQSRVADKTGSDHACSAELPYINQMYRTMTNLQCLRKKDTFSVKYNTEANKMATIYSRAFLCVNGKVLMEKNLLDIKPTYRALLNNEYQFPTTYTMVDVTKYINKEGDLTIDAPTTIVTKPKVYYDKTPILLDFTDVQDETCKKIRRNTPSLYNKFKRLSDVITLYHSDVPYIVIKKDNLSLKELMTMLIMNNITTIYYEQSTLDEIVKALQEHSINVITEYDPESNIKKSCASQTTSTKRHNRSTNTNIHTRSIGINTQKSEQKQSLKKENTRIDLDHISKVMKTVARVSSVINITYDLEQLMQLIKLKYTIMQQELNFAIPTEKDTVYEFGYYVTRINARMQRYKNLRQTLPAQTPIITKQHGQDEKDVEDLVSKVHVNDLITAPEPVAQTSSKRRARNGTSNMVMAIQTQQHPVSSVFEDAQRNMAYLAYTEWHKNYYNV